MKKVSILFSLLLVLCLGFTLAGCGEKQPNEPEEPAYTTLTLDETNDFINNAKFSAKHWNSVLHNRKIASGTASVLITKNTQNGANYVEIASPIYNEYEISQICIDGQTYNYVDETPVFIGEEQMDWDSLFLGMDETLSQFKNINGLAEMYDFIDTKKYVNESNYELHITFDIGEPNVEMMGADAITIRVRFNTNNLFDGMGAYLYFENEYVGEISFYNYTNPYTTPEWFDVHDFDDITLQEGTNKLNFEELSSSFSRMNFSMNDWKGISYALSNDEQLLTFGNLWQATENGENYMIRIIENGIEQRQFCKDGINYVYNDSVASEITTAQFSFSAMLNGANKEVLIFSDLETVITKLPFVSASVFLTLDGYIYDITFDASSIESVNADTLCLHLEFDIKRNLQGYEQSYMTGSQSIISTRFFKNLEQMSTPDWFDINDFQNL